MFDNILTERAVKFGEYIAENKATVRKTAEVFNISKSTVHKDISEKLKFINLNLYQEVKNILEINKAQRHIRGGLATKNKYFNLTTTPRI